MQICANAAFVISESYADAQSMTDTDRDGLCFISAIIGVCVFVPLQLLISLSGPIVRIRNANVGAMPDAVHFNRFEFSIELCR